MEKDISILIENNKAWAARQVERDPEFFARLARQQKPRYLWIGCSDSRVPANEIVGLAPGEVFVHRNIANQVVHTDLNCVSVMQFAVDFLKVEHIIVCGHYGCGGVKAALESNRHGIVDHWIRGIRDMHSLHSPELMGIDSEEKALDRMCELNVVQQVEHVCYSPLIQAVWKRGQKLAVHGWIYGIQDGLIRDLNVSFYGLENIPESQRIQ